MDNQPKQQFCTNCGQPLVPGTTFCATCGMPVNAPPTGTAGPFPAGTQAGSAPYAQGPMQAQDDLLLTGLAAASEVSRRGSPLRVRRPRSRLRGCGCLLLILAVLIGPFIGVALTTGKIHVIFTYVAVGMVIFIVLVLLIGMLATRGGREVLAEGCTEGCLDALLGGLLGGG